MRRKMISILELTLVVLSVFAFSYFVSTNLPDVLENPSESKFIQFLTRPIIPIVSANPILPSGCCKETISGAICQDMLIQDSHVCKTDLIGAGCRTVGECQKGCCYDADSGICSLNAPQEKCISNDGKWDASTTCEIPECQVGCCIMGDGASMMTTRECTQTANQYRITKDFRPLDMKGSCDIYSDTSAEGACLSDSGDFSGKKNCIFTTKNKCVSNNNEFKREYLCTSEELDTICQRTEKTSCFGDGVYFIDSCGNKANIYDSTKTDSLDYWEKIIAPSQSCIGDPTSCGNCDYATGSICTKYYNGKDMVKPNTGDYLCRNLNCANGKKHGESWCISDSETKDGKFSVGSRNYVATCFEGEIKLNGCADFNQEICVENKGEWEYTEAMCITNDWRSCIYANDADHYRDIKTKCDLLPQCVMFNEIPENEIYKDLPGFKEIDNNDQGRAEKVGDGSNKYIAHCVPKYTPGLQFWNTPSAKIISSKNQVGSNTNYGGNKQETDDTCRLGSFVCISHIEIDDGHKRDKENPECNWQAANQEKQEVPLMMEALNERCRSLGSCGLQYNVQEKLGETGFFVKRTRVGSSGGMTLNYTTDGYFFSDAYLDKLKLRQDSYIYGSINKLSQLTEFSNYAADITDSPRIDSNNQISNTFKIDEITGFKNKKNAGLALRKKAWWFIAGGPVGWIIMIVIMIVSLFLGKTEHVYYITEFKCEAWQPPLVGRCEECNNDVRPCTEYKCRSIGTNCQYFVENGEPGYCASLNDIWSAKIEPWNDILTTGNKYINVSSFGFRIVNDKQNSKEVDAWKIIKFGVITDKEAICKIDTNHSMKFGEMRYTMMSDRDYSTGKVDGLSHWVAVSPHVTTGDDEEIDASVTMPPMREGDNEYYIICQNFAGQVNDAPFVVSVKQADGPDLTPARIVRTTPQDQSYIPFNSTNTTIWLYLNEPAECKYSLEYDYNYFDEMPNNFSCLTGKDQGFYGEWPCATIINNISEDTKIYIKCRDQPELVETDLYKKNSDRISYEYKIFACKEGLNMDSISPVGNVETNGSRSINLEVKTSGCINDGQADCFYKLPYYGNAYSTFFYTGTNRHTQPLTGLSSGEKTVVVECQDIAGNVVNKEINFTVFFDDSPPKVTRIYEENKRIIIETDEKSSCSVNMNQTKGCDFDISGSNNFVLKHIISFNEKSDKQTLYLRCEDEKNNKPSGCTQIIKLVGSKQNV